MSVKKLCCNQPLPNDRLESLSNPTSYHPISTPKTAKLSQSHPLQFNCLSSSRVSASQSLEPTRISSSPPELSLFKG
ncbi:hypothetical protein Forpe1208_v013395 [Fusarium oxysporum f. sp. rapae]|uniref:Uncharacterized protein n=1 Tax=Fusarium oxysporum f. sp. rapae TaxID=485398 RepID=A0A8J5TR84_FUSOX|nr:hypothetical protein Forpe1208_v013395 [Fusarium oxysporum f. sp. rapae]